MNTPVNFGSAPDLSDCQFSVGGNTRAGLGHYDSKVVITLELSVKFLSLALVNESLAFQAHVVRSAKNFSFAEGFLSQAGTGPAQHLAIATAMVAPAR